MIFTRSSRKRTEKVSSDSAALSFDLLSNLTYMSAVSTGDVPRDIIFEFAVRQAFKTSIYFKQVYQLTKRLGFEYGRSFQLVSGKAKAASVKGLMLRFAGSITSGVSEHEFLTQESRVETDQYVNQYQRSLETLSKWADAYAALLVSVTLIVVIAMVTTMLYDIGQLFVLMLNATMFFMSLFGAFIIYKTAPYEETTFKGDKSKGHKGPRERQRASFLLLLFLPVGVLGGMVLAITSGLGFGLFVLGLCLMPAGVYAYMDDSKVTNLDMEVDKFFRSVGNVAGALGTTLSNAMTRIDRRSLGTMEPYIRRLQARLGSRITPKVCWDKFIDETGSELVNRSTNMFVDGTTVGGAPEKVGAITADYALSISLLRARRHVTALPFAYLTIPLHGAMTALLVFIMEIMISFNDKLTQAGAELISDSGGFIASVPSLPVFQPKDMTQTTMMTMGAVLILTISNSLAPKFATGGHNLKLAFYGGIMCIISGLNLMLIPGIAHGLLE